MRLKKLELQGFKSFGKKTVLNFSEGVTGIVGPNGSGKSNIVDAIRWVLGEQKSKDLRLDKMSDVLFNGTKTKKRTGLAQVTITFDNDKGLLPVEYQEVAISRLLYRDGDSAYKLNGVTCRRKDIQTLLANTGIGSNTYAIIQLGMVDDILRDKQNARRRMFEQSAGIYSFKKRKHETELKLKATNEDLDRVEDLLHEIKNNLKQLERQARRAERYLKLKAQYRDCAILLAAHKVSAYSATYSELKESVATLQVEHSELTAKLNTQKAAIQDDRASLDDRQRILTESQQLVRSSENLCMRLSSEIDLLTRDITHLKSNINQSEATKQTSADRVADHRLQLAEIDGKKEALELTIKKLGGTVADALKERDELYQEAKRSEEGKDGLVKQLQSLSDQIAEHQRVKAVQDNLLYKYEDELLELNKEAEEQDNKVAAWRTQLIELSDRMDLHRQEINSRSQRLTDLEANKAALEQDIEVAAEHKQDIARSIDAKKNEHSLLTNMVDNLEGYPESIKFLAKEHKWEGAAVLLSEVLLCDPAYRNALEAILEPYLNCYIVPHSAEALHAVKVLREAQKGKATFLVSRGVEQTSDEINPPDGFARAIDLVQVDEAYQPLFHQLLRGVCVQRSASDTMPLELGYDGLTLVDQQGLLIHSAYQVSGGSSGLFDGMKIGRRKQLEALGKEIEVLEREQSERAERWMKLRQELEQIDTRQPRQELEQQQHLLVGVEKEHHLITKRVEEQQEANTRLQDRLAINAEQTDRAKQLSLVAEQAIPPLIEQRQSCHQQMASESEGINALNQRLSKANEDYSAANMTYVEHKGRMDQYQQQYDMISQRITELEKEAVRAGDTLGNWQQDLDGKTQKLESTSQSRTEEEQRFKSLSIERDRHQERYVEIKNKLLAQEHELTKSNSLYQRLLQQIESTKDAYNDVRIQLNDVTQRVKVEFNVQNDVLVATEVPEGYQVEDEEANVEKLRTKIHNFGEVNPMAVEAYEEIKNRHDHIDAQRQDILDAQLSLRKTIKELDDEATKQFLEAFDKIKMYFQQIFRTLFNPEDTCDLILVDEEQPLESPIDIVAKPKGKRPVSLSQLSGGETTLTATALLFALYLLKPAPFCIFDEVDAPLDDMNIKKFNDIIKKFSGDSQFIIITHNKLTMAAVDVIYGVYMDEPGISGVASVDFRSLIEAS